jgi:hypothetical protein
VVWGGPTVEASIRQFEKQKVSDDASLNSNVQIVLNFSMQFVLLVRDNAVLPSMRLANKVLATYFL